MTHIVIDDDQAQRTLRIIGGIYPRLAPELRTALRESARDVAARTRAILRRKIRGPSAPGEPPARDSGDLARSIRFRSDRRRLVASVRANQFYGRFLETGRSRRRRRGGGLVGAMAPRPFISTAMDDRAEATRERLARAIGDLLDRTAREAS